MNETPARIHEPIRVNLGYRDVPAAIRFLVDALGFEQGVIHQDDDGEVHYAELRWPAGGIVTLHSGGAGNSIADLSRLAAASGYPAYSIHIDVNDPDDRYRRAVAAGAAVVRELRDSTAGLGTRGFIVRDPEGLYWSLGTPLPELERGPDGRWRPAAET